MKYCHENSSLEFEDGGPDIWESVLGQSWEEFVDLAKGIYEYEYKKKGDSVNRNDVLRPWFNTLCRADGKTLDVNGVKRFYSLSDGLYCKMMAYECGRDKILTNRLNKGHVILGYQEYSRSINEVISNFGRGEKLLNVLDHGAGMGNTSTALLQIGFNVTMYDYDTPHKKALMKSIGRFGESFGLEADKIRIMDAGVYDVNECGKMHMVVSQDVMEHLIDPIEELHRIASILEVGGYLVMGTFFNSCNGQDPQHLEEHNKFQDCELWFSEVQKAGFEPAIYDQNGVLKAWERV